MTRRPNEPYPGRQADSFFPTAEYAAKTAGVLTLFTLVLHGVFPSLTTVLALMFHAALASSLWLWVLLDRRGTPRAARVAAVGTCFIVAAALVWLLTTAIGGPLAG